MIKFDEQKNEFFTNDNLNEFLKSNEKPKLVLRVIPQEAKVSSDRPVQKNYSYLYGVMENELLKLGFTIKDRSTFNEILSKTNSSELLKKELSDADLILEVVKIDDKVPYSTNKVSSIKKEELSQKQQQLNYKSIGAFVEYRIILVKSNEIGGTYKFHYQPCPHGCAIEDFKLSGKEKDLKLTKSITQEIMQQFISTSIQEMVYFLQSTKKQETDKK